MLTARRTGGMLSLDVPRVTYVVAFLLFATGIGHALVTGEAKSHIKNLIYSPPVTTEADHPDWRCCLDLPMNVTQGYELQAKPYQRPEHPSNGSYFYGRLTHQLESSKWVDKTVSFVGGSVTRQNA